MADDGRPQGCGLGGWNLVCVGYAALLVVAALVDWLLDEFFADPNSLASFFTDLLAAPSSFWFAEPLADAFDPEWVVLPIWSSLVAGLVQVAVVWLLGYLLIVLYRWRRSRTAQAP